MLQCTGFGPQGFAYKIWDTNLTCARYVPFQVIKRKCNLFFILGGVIAVRLVGKCHAEVGML